MSRKIQIRFANLLCTRERLTVHEVLVEGILIGTLYQTPEIWNSETWLAEENTPLAEILPELLDPENPKSLTWVESRLKSAEIPEKFLEEPKFTKPSKKASTKKKPTTKKSKKVRKFS